MDRLVYKIAPRPLWEAAEATGVFAGASIDFEDGFIHLVDRKKDMVLRGGENISPGEIEDVRVWRCRRMGVGCDRGRRHRDGGGTGGDWHGGACDGAGPCDPAAELS